MEIVAEECRKILHKAQENIDFIRGEFSMNRGDNPILTFNCGIKHAMLKVLELINVAAPPQSPPTRS